MLLLNIYLCCWNAVQPAVIILFLLILLGFVSSLVSWIGCCMFVRGIEFDCFIWTYIVVFSTVITFVSFLSSSSSQYVCLSSLVIVTFLAGCNRIGVGLVSFSSW